MLDSCSIHRGWLLLDSCSTASQYAEVLLHALFFTCFASFFYLVIHRILFHYIHPFIWILCTPLIIFMFLGWNFLASCILCQSWQKVGEIVKKMWFLFKILHVRDHVRGSVYLFLFVQWSCDYFYIHCASLTSTCVISFLSLYTYFFIICNLLFLFHTKML